MDAIRQAAREDQAITLYNEGVGLLNSGNYKEALPRFEAATKLDPDNPKIHGALGRDLIELGRGEEGVKFLLQAQKEDPTDPSFIWNTSYAYESLGNFSKAVEEFEKYRKITNLRSAEVNAKLQSLKEQNALLERARRMPGGASRKDYFVFVTMEVGVCRWKSRTAPLRFYVDRPKDVHGHKPHFEQLVVKAFARWEKAAGGKLKFKQVQEPKRADIRCHFVDNPREFSSPIKAGDTQTVNSWDGIRSAYIKILTVDRQSGDLQSDEEIHATALHEVGHALGLSGHSPDPNDIMFFSGGKVKDLSHRDQETLRMLYSSAKAYMPPKGSKAEKQAESARAYNEHIKIYNAGVAAYDKKRYKLAIDKANEYLKIVPNDDYAKDLLELACNEQALECMGKGDLDQAELLLNQARAITYKKMRHRTRAFTQANYQELQKKRNGT